MTHYSAVKINNYNNQKIFYTCKGFSGGNMLLAHNNLKSEFDNLYDTIKNHADNGLSYIEIYKLISSAFSGTRQQFYSLYRAKKDLRDTQKLLDEEREKQIIELLRKGRKISHIAKDLNVARSVVYDKAKKHDIDVAYKIPIKKTSDDIFIPKKNHTIIPKRQNEAFATFIYANGHTYFASDEQCVNIFSAIDEQGDYWCGNYRDVENKNKHSRRYCKNCQKIVYTKRKELNL